MWGITCHFPTSETVGSASLHHLRVDCTVSSFSELLILLPALLLTPTVMVTILAMTSMIRIWYADPNMGCEWFQWNVQQQSDSRKTTAISTADACYKVPGLASTYALQPSPTNAGSFL